MRTKILFTSLLALSAIAGVAHAETRYVAADDSTPTRLCVSAVSDARIRFYTEVRDSGMNMRAVDKMVTCNGQNIGTFALNAGRKDNAHQLMRHEPGYIDVREVSFIQPESTQKVADNTVVIVKGR